MVEFNKLPIDTEHAILMSQYNLSTKFLNHLKNSRPKKPLGFSWAKDVTKD
jgi:hypothetical protein